MMFMNYVDLIVTDLLSYAVIPIDAFMAGNQNASVNTKLAPYFRRPFIRIVVW